MRHPSHPFFLSKKKEIYKNTSDIFCTFASQFKIQKEFYATWEVFLVPFPPKNV